MCLRSASPPTHLRTVDVFFITDQAFLNIYLNVLGAHIRSLPSEILNNNTKVIYTGQEHGHGQLYRHHSIKIECIQMVEKNVLPVLS